MFMIRKRLPSQRQAEILDILMNKRKYGREIRNEYEKRTDRRLTLGSLYATLTRMETYGFVRSWLGEPTDKRGGNRRKYFEITGAGQKTLGAFDVFNTVISGVSGSVSRTLR